MHRNVAAEAIKKAIRKEVGRTSAYRAEGNGLLDGRAVIRSDPLTAVDDDETYGVLVPAAPTPGYDSAMLMIGGNVVHAGVIVQGGSNDLQVGIGQTIVIGEDQANADNPSTTNTGAFVNAMALTWNAASAPSLPDGVYDFTVQGSFLGGHSGSDFVDFRVEAGSLVGNALSRDVPSGIPSSRVMSVQTFPNVTVSGGIAFSVVYRRGDVLVGETASARNPALLIIATRKG